MGDRAVITTEQNFKKNGVGIYLHWYGEPYYVRGFLEYAKLKGYRPPDIDSYGFARLCQIIGNYIGGGLSLGIDRLRELDTNNGDNGVYIIKGWDIVKREYNCVNSREDTIPLTEIDIRQPLKEQLGTEYLLADLVPVSELKLGDEVWMYELQSGDHPQTYTVAGFGEDTVINGHNVKGVPFIMMYHSDVCPTRRNINNYLFDSHYRIRH